MADSRSNEILECVLPYIQDPRDRAAISLVCWQFHELDRLTRRQVKISFCYSTTPQRLRDRFPNIESLKLKGKPRGAMFGYIPENWGGYVRPWVDVLRDFPRLNSLYFKRMIVRDEDLETIATVKGLALQSLKLHMCSGFSTDGLLHITRSCRNLRTLFMEASNITERDGEWFHQLAMSNTVLETINFYLTYMREIRVEDLELLGNTCPLTSVKIGLTDLIRLVKVFRITSATLQEFCGGFIAGELGQYPDILFPPRLRSVGIMYLLETQIPILFPVAHQLKKLDLTFSSLNIEGYCNILRRCSNLEVLLMTNMAGDRGLQIVSSTCKRLKRLRLERATDEDDEQGRLVVPGVVTQRGLIAVAMGCLELEYFAAYVCDITNEALECIGSNLRNLNDFRILLLPTQHKVTDLPLDNGVRALLQGCQNMRRFSLYLTPGGLSDVGLGYIAQLSENVRSMFFGCLGVTDTGLLEFSRGCPSLVKLEIDVCCFTDRALAVAATRLRSLRFMWVRDFQVSRLGIIDLRQMARPLWNIELVARNPSNNDNGQRHERVSSSNIVAYYSLAGQRTDHPETDHWAP